MRKWILGAAALLAVALPGMAAAQTTGSLGFSYANHDFDDFDEDIDTYGIDGAIAHDLGNGWTVQADGATDRADLDGFNGGVSYGAINLGMRNENHALYGWLGLNDLFGASGVTVGVGGQMHFAQASIDASVGYADFSDTFIDDGNITNVHLDGTWFFTDNFGVTAEAGWTEADFDSDDVDWTTLGIGASYRFDGTPWTVYGGYQNRDTDFGDVDSFRIGVAFAIGTGTSREERQVGPSWNGAESLFNETRAVIVL